MRSGDSPPAAQPAPAAPLTGVPLAWPVQADDLPRRYADRAALAAELRRRFPAAAGGLSPIRGGRRAAEARLAAIDPPRYGASRNHLDGAVTHLSPYLRHGVLSLAEVREAVFAWLARHGEGDPAADRERVEKLLSELGWRDYWQRLWRRWGDGIWRDREPPATGLPAAAPRLPEEIAAGRTGLACIDAMATQLRQEGWLHNHARMWLAAYVVHWRRVRWQAGAAWFLEHLLDGDPASNNLSWQWVAGSFSGRPYLFNRANLERYGGGRWCRRCPRAAAGGADAPAGCPFEASYERLRQRLFPGGPGAPDRAHPRDERPDPGAGAAPHPGGAPQPRRPVLWIHGEALGPANPALRAWPGRPALFVFDTELLAGRTATTAPPDADGIADDGRTTGAPLSLKRLGFLLECLLELPVSVRSGAVAAELIGFARRHGADAVVTSAAVDPRFALLRERIGAALPLHVLEPEPFVRLEPPLDLRRFHRYWRRAGPRLWAMRRGDGDGG